MQFICISELSSLHPIERLPRQLGLFRFHELDLICLSSPARLAPEDSLLDTLSGFLLILGIYRSDSSIEESFRYYESLPWGMQMHTPGVDWTSNLF